MLILATQECHKDTVSVLLEGRASPNITEKVSLDGVRFCSQSGKEEASLIDGGANPRLLDQVKYMQCVCVLLNSTLFSLTEWRHTIFVGTAPPPPHGSL